MNKSFLTSLLLLIGLSACKTKALLIDDFETKNCISKQKWTWYSGSDSSNGGKSFISKTNVMYAKDDSVQYGAFDFVINKGNFKWPYIEIGLKADSNQIPFKVNFTKAISYRYKGPAHNCKILLRTVTDYANYEHAVAKSENWQTIVLPISEFKQPKFWGKKVDLTLSDFRGISWAINGNGGEKGRLQFDDIKLHTKIPKDPDNSIETEKKEEKIEKKPLKDLPSFIKVATWPEFRKAAYSLTFDDGLLSQYVHLKPVLDKYNFKASFFVLPTLQKYDSLPTTWRSGYEWQFRKLQSEGHEVSSHSMSHADLTTLPIGNAKIAGTLRYELIESKKYISETFKTNSLTIAYPYTTFNNVTVDETAKNYVAARASVGVGYNSASPSKMTQLDAATISFTPTRTVESDKALTQELIEKMDKKCIQLGGWGIMFAHDVLPFKEAMKATDTWHPFTPEIINDLCIFLKEKENQNQVWVAPMANVAMYIQERENLKMFDYKETEKEISLTLTDQLRDNDFKQELTVRINMPSAWKKASIKVNSTENIIFTNQVEITVLPDSKLLLNKID